MSLIAHAVGNYIIKHSPTEGRRMTTKESEFLLRIIMAGKQMDSLHDEMMACVPYAILHKRLAGMRGPVASTAAKAFLTELTGGSPGNAVMFAAVVSTVAASLEKDDVSLNDIIEHAFPFNVPSEKVLQAAWETQKGVTIDGQWCDNGLDHPKAWSAVA